VLRYLKQPDEKSRRIGWIALILTIVMTIATLWLAVVAMDSFNQLVNSMLGGGQF
jgi:flagellar basal body-associated protein FliL